MVLHLFSLGKLIAKVPMDGAEFILVEGTSTKERFTMVISQAGED